MMKSVTAAKLLCWTSLIAIASPAIAGVTHEADAPVPSMRAGNLESDADILVTARQVYQPTVTSFEDFGTDRILDTPFSVNSISSELVEIRQAVSILDLQKIDPTIQVNFRGYANFVNLRGFRSRSLNTRLEGTPTPENAAIPLEVMDRVDVLRGPSGFLFGSTAPGGVINYILKRPNDTPLTRVGLRYSSDSNFIGTIDISRRFGGDDGLGVRVAGAIERGYDYQPGNNAHRYVGSIALDWSPLENLHLQADALFARDAPTDGGGYQVFRASPTDQPISPLDPSKRYSQLWEYQTHITRAYGTKAEWEFAPDWSLSVSGRQFDQPFTYFYSVYFLQPGRNYTGAVFNQRAEEVFTTGEVKLRGKFDTGVLKNVVNLSVLTQHDSFSQWYRGFISINPGSLDNPTLNIPKPTNPLAPGQKYLVNTSLQQSIALSDAISLDSWTLLLALRHVSITQKTFDPNIVPGTDTQNFRNLQSKLAPTFGLVKKFGEHLSTYASYAEGLEPGDTAPSTANNASQVLPPNESKQAEFGIKAELLAGMTATAAVFKIERDYTYTNMSNDFVKAGKQSHTGAEVTFGGAITRNLAAYGGITYIDAKIKNVKDTLITSVSVEGSRPIGVAKWQGSLFVEYRIAPDLFLNGNIFYSGDKYVAIPNIYEIAGYTTFDVGARYNFKVGNQRIALNGTLGNLFDKRYWAAADNNRYLSLGVPRQIKLSATVAF